MPAPYRAVLLDIDGTLIDSNWQHAEAWAKALTDCGHPANARTMLALIGMGGDQILPLVTGLESKSERGKAILEHRKKVFKDQFLEQIKPIPGAREAVWAAMARGVIIKITTSAAPEELTGLLKIAGLEDLAANAVMAEGDMPSKPNPALVQKAVHVLAFEPSEVVMLGDTEYDIEAAKAAGVDCLAVRTGGRSDATLAGAVRTYNTVAEALADDIFALPTIAQAH